MIEAAAKKGVKKFILLTSIGVGDSKDAPPQQVYDVLKPVLVEKGKAEERLKVSTLTQAVGQIMKHLLKVHQSLEFCKINDLPLAQLDLHALCIVWASHGQTDVHLMYAGRR